MTIKDIAEKCGVSVATVSRVINGIDVVKPEVKEKIQKFIEDNQYVPNTIARGLVRQKSNTIGVMTPRFHGYYMPRIEAIMKQTSEYGYNVLLGSGYGHFTGETDALRMLEENRIEGLIYIAAKYTEEKVGELKRISKKIPVVLMDQRHDSLNFDIVKFDYYDASVQAVEYLIRMGHRKIAFIGGPYYDADSITRKNAYIFAMTQHGLSIPPSYTAEGFYSINSGYKAAIDIMEAINDYPTAVFTGNDFMAIGAIRAFSDKGLKVPDDISVIGIDDVEISENYNPPLTTMKSDQHKAGTKATEILFRRMNGEEFNIYKEEIKTTLVERNSVKAIQ